MPPDESTTVLTDYFGERGIVRVTVLAEFEGDGDARGMAYRIGDRLIKANNDLVNNFTGIPNQFRENWSLLRDPTQRRLLARSLVDESLLTQQRRRALYSMVLASVVLGFALAGLLIAFIDPAALGTYQAIVTLFSYSLLTSLLLPTPFEFLLTQGREVLGIVWTVLVAATAKTAGAWLVLLAGDRVGAGLDEALRERPKLRAAWDRVLVWARRYGYAISFVLFAIPFSPDTLPLFLLAMMDLRKSVFLAVTFAAIVVRSLLFLLVGGIF